MLTGRERFAFQPLKLPRLKELSMTKINKSLTDDQQSMIEDLTITEDQAVQVKGGEQLPSSIIVVMGDGSVRH